MPPWQPPGAAVVVVEEMAPLTSPRREADAAEALAHLKSPSPEAVVVEELAVEQWPLKKAVVAEELAPLKSPRHDAEAVEALAHLKSASPEAEAAEGLAPCSSSVRMPWRHGRRHRCCLPAYQGVSGGISPCKPCAALPYQRAPAGRGSCVPRS